MPSPTPPFDRAIALACTLQTLRGRWLYVRCGCQASSCHPVRLMLRDDPSASGRTLADELVRLRCNTCGARPAAVHLTETPLPPDVVPTPLLYQLASLVRAGGKVGLASADEEVCDQAPDMLMLVLATPEGEG